MEPKSHGLITLVSGPNNRSRRLAVLNEFITYMENPPVAKPNVRLYVGTGDFNAIDRDTIYLLSTLIPNKGEAYSSGYFDGSLGCTMDCIRAHYKAKHDGLLGFHGPDFDRSVYEYPTTPKHTELDAVFVLTMRPAALVDMVNSLAPVFWVGKTKFIIGLGE